eukprot:6895776-Heterocapsa_arctica.AAC.1
MKEELRVNCKAPTTDMEVILGHDEIGDVCMKMKNPTDLRAKADRCCKDPKKCMMCKAVADTYDVQKYKIEKSHTQGIEKYLEEQKEEKTWKEANNEQKMLMICYALTQIRAERKYISGFGA